MCDVLKNWGINSRKWGKTVTHCPSLNILDYQP